MNCSHFLKAFFLPTVEFRREVWALPIGWVRCGIDPSLERRLKYEKLGLLLLFLELFLEVGAWDEARCISRSGVWVVERLLPLKPTDCDRWDEDDIGGYRRKAKYLIGVILDLVLAVFKFWFHEIFVVIKKYYCRVVQFHGIFASTIIIIIN